MTLIDDSFSFFLHSTSCNPIEKNLLLLFSPNRLVVRRFFYIFALDKASHLADKWCQDIEEILRPTMLFVGQAEGKGVNGRYRSVTSNFATLNPYIEVMQR